MSATYFPRKKSALLSTIYISHSLVTVKRTIWEKYNGDHIVIIIFFRLKYFNRTRTLLYGEPLVVFKKPGAIGLNVFYIRFKWNFSKKKKIIAFRMSFSYRRLNFDKKFDKRVELI